MVIDEFSIHKPHGAWYRQRACYPLNDRSPVNLELHWREREADTTWSPSEFPWECLGPFNVAGRTTSLVAHPTDHELLFAGAANGGVWRSKDGGGSWEWSWAKWASPAIGALAFDPADTNTVYVATGEANGSPDCYPGTGIYATHDLGETWALLADAGALKLPRRIGALVPNPYEPGTIWIGGVTDEESQPAGFYYSADSGKT